MAIFLYLFLVAFFNLRNVSCIEKFRELEAKNAFISSERQLGQINHKNDLMLEFVSDKTLDWTWIELKEPRVRQLNVGADHQINFSGVIQLDLSTAALTNGEELEKSTLNGGGTRKAKIYFPYLKPTNDERCRFGYKYRKRENPRIDPGRAEFLWANEQVWPHVTVLLISPADDGASGKQNQQRLTNIRSLSSVYYEDSTYEQDVSMQVGEQARGSWKLVLEVETRLDAGLFELSEIRFTNCSPLTELGPVMDLEQMFRDTCKDSSKFFQCKLSGRCINLDYRCDFGSDCGPRDDSDEFNCHSDFQGRCNFEQADQCQWLATPATRSWIRTSVSTGKNETSDQKQLESGIVSHVSHLRPVVDHTFRSPQVGGHYLLLRTKFLEASNPSAQLIGPIIRLRSGSETCKFRFWVHTPATMRELELKSVHLAVGTARISADKIFKLDEEVSSTVVALAQGWRRFQVTLLNQSDHEPLFPFSISLDNLGQDLAALAEVNGYIALDDFSFSQGCELTVENQAPESMCNEAEFRCSVPSPLTPNQFCIPLNRICDFKPDCGPDEKLKKIFGHHRDGQVPQILASDELLCADEYDVTNKLSDFQKSGLHLIGVYPTLATKNDQQSTKEAFAVDLPEEFECGSTSPLVVGAQFGQFKRNFLSASDAEKFSFIKNVGLILPKFHQAHANCSLDLTYSWSEDAADLVLNVYLLKTTTSVRYAKINSVERSPSGLQEVLAFGIGEQNEPFNIYLEVTFGSAASNKVERFSGEFRLWHYRFINCNHAPSRVNMTQMHVSQTETPNNEGKENLASGQRKGGQLCEANQIQCEQPTMCLDDRFVCDFQRDCQESNLDELDCSNRGFVQFDFESGEEGLFNWSRSSYSFGGSSGDSQNTGNGSNPSLGMGGGEWVVKRAAARDDEQGWRMSPPPVDHTNREPGPGNYLTFSRLKAPDGNAQIESSLAANPSIQSIIYTPKLKLTKGCSRLVAHLYHWPSASNHPRNYWANVGELEHFGIHVKFFNSASGQTDKCGACLGSKHLLWPTRQTRTVEGEKFKFGVWQRVELKTHAADFLEVCGGSDSNACDFAIGFQLDLPTKADALKSMLAIDDISLGPDCQLVDERLYSPEREPPQSGKPFQAESSFMSVLLTSVLVAGVFLSLITTAVLLFKRNRRLNQRTYNLSEPDPDELDAGREEIALEQF